MKLEKTRDRKQKGLSKNLAIIGNILILTNETRFLTK
jgi:hypothetical protein